MRASLLVALVLIGLAAFNAAEASNRLRKLRATVVADADTETEAISETDAAVAVDAAVLQALQDSEAVDGTWHVYSDAITEKAHEGITAYAVSQATPALWDAKKIEQGTIWNDMPSGADGNQAELDATLKDGHMDIDTWTREFFGGKDNELVHNVHYGCLQHFHSMAPIPRSMLSQSPATRVVFTNSDVRGFIISQFKAWWNAIVAAVKKGGPQAKEWYSWYAGHMLHMLQDSYPRGHAVRDSTATACGNIVLFQGYDAQHGNDAHKAGDFTPPKRKETDPSLPKRYECARAQSAQLLRYLAVCINAKGNGPSCVFNPIGNWLTNTVYKFAPGAERRIAGGSRADFAKKDIAKDFNEEKNVNIGTGTVSLFNPKSTNTWSKARGTRLCGGPLLSKVKLGSFFYTQRPFNGFVEFQAPVSSK